MINYLNNLILRNGHLAQKQKTDKNFFCVLKEKFLPLLFLHPSTKMWESDRDEYYSYRISLENRALCELKDAFRVLKERLLNNHLLNSNTLIKQRICIIESILEFSGDEYVSNTDNELCSNCGAVRKKHNIYASPSYIYGLYTEICYLCDEIISLEQKDILDGFVQTKYIDKYIKDGSVFQKRCCLCCKYIYDSNTAPRNTNGGPIHFDELDSEWVCPECSSDQSFFLPINSDTKLEKVPLIETFTFAPSYFELIELDMNFESWKRNPSKAPVWVMWEILTSVKWLFDLSPDFFRKKKLRYINPETLTRSIRLLELRTNKIALMSIKQKCQDKDEKFYKRERYDESLVPVMKELEAANNYMLSPLYPISIELLIENELYLRLKIEWIKGVFEYCDLHLFRDEDDSTILKFIEDLLEKPGTYSILDKNAATGVSVSKYLKRVGICKVLQMVFIAEKFTYSASLGAKRKNLANLPETNLRKLLSKIDTLRTNRWEFTESKNSE